MTFIYIGMGLSVLCAIWASYSYATTVRTRNEVLKFLRDNKQSYSVDYIANELGLTKSSVMYELAVLQWKGLVQERYDHNFEIYYRANEVKYEPSPRRADRRTV